MGDTDHRSRHAQVLQRQPIVNMRLLLLSWFCFQVSLAQSLEDLPDGNLKVKEILPDINPNLLEFAKKSLDYFCALILKMIVLCSNVCNNQSKYLVLCM